MRQMLSFRPEHNQGQVHLEHFITHSETLYLLFFKCLHRTCASSLVHTTRGSMRA